MDSIFIGKLVNTHGIKGEVKLISDFKYKTEVFKPNNKIYINNKDYIIKSYRHHKIFDMLILNNIDNIEDASKLKGFDVYINRLDYNFDGYLEEDLIGMSVYDNAKYKGKVIDIIKTNYNSILVIDGIKKHMVPNIPNFVKNIDMKNKKINIEYIEGLDNEN